MKYQRSMYDQTTGLFQDPYIPQEYNLIDGYGAREPQTEWGQDFITLISEHEEIIEDQ